MEGEDKTFVYPPEIKLETEGAPSDPSQGTVAQKARRLSVEESRSPRSPGRMTAESIRSQLSIKEGTIEREFESLSASLKAEEFNVQQVKGDLDFLRYQVDEGKKLIGKLVENLIKTNQINEINVEESRLSRLHKRFFIAEQEALEKIKLFLEQRVVATNGQDGRDEHPVTEYQMVEADAFNLKKLLEHLEDLINIGSRDGLMDAVDAVAVQAEEYVTSHAVLVEALRAHRLVNEAQVEKNKKIRLLQRKLELERKVQALLPTPTTETKEDMRALQFYRNDLPKLTGNLKDWNPFWALFKDIDADPKLSEVQKFQLLIKSTTENSEARDILNTYTMGAENYRPALNHLKDVYGKDAVLIKVYVREMLQLAIDKSSGKKIEMRKLVNTLTAQLRNLEVLGVTADKCALVLYPVVEACLPQRILEQWQHSKEYADKLDALVKFLKVEVNLEAERKMAHFQFGDASKTNSNKTNTSTSKSPTEGRKYSTPTATTLHNKEMTTACIFCEKQHSSSDCYTALKMEYADKEGIIKKKGACFTCLEKGHIKNSCPFKDKLKCELCTKRHHKVMCHILDQDGKGSSSKSSKNKKNTEKPDDKKEQEPEAGPSSSLPMGSASLSNTVYSADVPLQMLTLTVHGVTGRRKLVRAMFDSGSQKSYITTALAEEVGFQHMGKEEVIHQLFGGGISAPVQHDKVMLYIGGKDQEAWCNFDVSCIKKITAPSSISEIGPWKKDFEEKGVKFHDFSRCSTEVEVLLGNDVAPRLYTGKIVDLGYGPVAMQTIWGWVLGGKIPCNRKDKDSTNSMVCLTTSLINNTIAALWDLETIGITDLATTQSKEEINKQTQDHFDKTVKRLDSGRYEVALPFLAGATDSLPSNFYSAERRLRTTTENLRKQNYLSEYDKLFKQWEADEIIEPVKDLENNFQGIGHYLPHRAVVKLSSETTPIRPVFDASARTKGKPSLNMCVEVGPNYLEQIGSILTRFRLNRVGVTADVKRAFQQISIIPSHRDYLRFLWWEDLSCSKLKVYRHSRVVFGVACSPFLLAATLQYHLKNSPEKHLKVVSQLMESFYVDNCVISVTNRQEADIFKENATGLLKPALFDLRAWEIGPTDYEKETPVLGMIWRMGEDTLVVDVKSALERNEQVNTQRSVLALAHSLFDPLGVLCPFILHVKLILRKCHELRLGWDTPLPEEIKEKVKRWNNQIHLLTEARIPRHVFYNDGKEHSLHVFVDASNEAYAAVVYLRCVLRHEVKVSLMQAKSRISPKKTTSIPRLELLACLIGCRLAQTVAKDMRNTTIPITYWSDSSTALAWIKRAGPWAVFVANRVTEIREKTSPSQWFHIPGKENPADLPSRGCSAAKLVEDKWWNGPKWLYEQEDCWPKSTPEYLDDQSINEEKRKTVIVNLAVEDDHPIRKFLKYSVYPRMIRALACWIKYRRCLRLRIGERKVLLSPINRQLPHPFITHEEFEEAEMVMIRHVQTPLNNQPSRLLKLRPFLNDQGILQTTTRILNDEENFIKPIILPDDDEFVRRLIYNIHVNNCHIGPQLLLAKIRERFWLLNGRRTVRKVVGRCWTCRRFNARSLLVPEPPLPKTRTGIGAPFNVTGLDLAGPLLLRKGKKTIDSPQKVWVALFTCASYRAIHMEVLDGLSTEELFLAMRAFICRRGKPSVIHSDNGLNLVGANSTLQEVYKKEANQFALEKRIKWIFNPPTAAWWGGWWERMIGLVKQLLRRVLGSRAVHRKELTILLMEVEEAINNRPLTYLTDHADDPMPLTPNMLIRNSGLAFFPELDVRDATTARAAYKRVQRLREALHSRFRKEYLGQLQYQRKVQTATPLKMGDVVLIEKENEKRQGWPLGVIMEALPGRDNYPRAYRVKTRAGIIIRPAQRLYLMELNEKEE